MFANEAIRAGAEKTVICGHEPDFLDGGAGFDLVRHACGGLKFLATAHGPRLETFVQRLLADALHGQAEGVILGRLREVALVRAGLQARTGQFEVRRRDAAGAQLVPLGAALRYAVDDHCSAPSSFALAAATTLKAFQPATSPAS
ncbi:hypothetical protein D3C86_1264710 [compost metagenome]